MTVFVCRHIPRLLTLLAGPETSNLSLRGLARCISALALAVFVLAAIFLSPSHASSEEWEVKRVSGIVYFVAPGVEAFRVKKGMVFEKGYTMGTRPGARALIARGSETIAVGPNTTFAISKYRSKGTKTTLLQRKGTIEVDVEKRRRPHFSVETPFFAAVVKGTRFEVRVREDRASVAVERGVVAVEDFASGDRTDLTAGQSASSAPTRKVGLSVAGKTKPEVTSGAKRAPVFETPAVKNVPTFAGPSNKGGNPPSVGVSANDGHAGNKGISNASGAANSAASGSNSAGGGNAGSGNSSNSGSSGSSGGSSNGSSGGSGNGSSGGNGNGSSGGNGKNR